MEVKNENLNLFDYVDDESFAPETKSDPFEIVTFSTLTFTAPTASFHQKLGRNHCFFIYGSVGYIPGVKTRQYSKAGSLAISIDSVDMTEKKTDEGFWFVLVIPFDEKSPNVQHTEDELVGMFSMYFGQHWAYEKIFHNDYILPSRTLEMSGPSIESPEHVKKVDVTNQSMTKFSEIVVQLENSSAEVREKVFATLRWYRKATGQFGIEGFVFLWTGLEVVGKDGSQELRILRAKMIDLYQVEESQIENQFYIGHLESFRGKVLHKGYDAPIDGKILDYLRRLIDDLLINLITGEKSNRAQLFMKENRKQIIAAVESYK